jgi:transposase InsO family protein
LKKENRLWGPKRIHGELIKLGVQVSETTVRNVLRRANLRPWDGQGSENWKSFFKRHKNIWAIDFFTVHSATFKRMFVLVIMDIHSRRLISTRVTPHPTAEWTARVLNFEITEGDIPDGIVHDRDPAFESVQFRDLLNQNDVKNLRCPRRTPLANAFVERLNGTLQRECTDHFLFFNEAKRQRVLKEYQSYYNQARPHQGLGQRIPNSRETNELPMIKGASLKKVVSRPVLEGLHHDY